MILVTGAAGYIGSHFVKRFLKTRQSSEKILALDNLSTGHRLAIPESERVVFAECDLQEAEKVSALVTKYGITAAVHFAASCYVGESEQAPFKYYQNNVSNTISLLRVLDDANIRNFVFSSSCAVYGVPSYLPLTEKHDRNPISVYGQTKLITELLLESLNRTRSLSFVALRYFNAAGADEAAEIGESHAPETHLIPNALRVLSGAQANLEIYGDDFDTTDGTCVRDYVHVNDLADAHIAALNLLEGGKIAEFINLGSGDGYSVNEIVAKCAELTGRQLPIIVKPRRQGDPARLVANYDKARRLLSWKPQYNLEKILQTAWNWELNRRY